MPFSLGYIKSTVTTAFSQSLTNISIKTDSINEMFARTINNVTKTH